MQSKQAGSVPRSRCNPQICYKCDKARDILRKLPTGANTAVDLANTLVKDKD
jgi:hypothetical protein